MFNKKQSSKDIARERLKVVVIHDRADCSTQILEMLKIDILKVISNYMEIDETELDIQITQTKSDHNSTVPMMIANIPIKSMRKVQSRP